MDANRKYRKAKRLIALAGFFLAAAILATVFAAVHWETLQKIYPDEPTATSRHITDLTSSQEIDALCSQLKETFQVSARLDLKVLRSGSKALVLRLNMNTVELKGLQRSIHADTIARFVKNKAAWVNEVDLMEIHLSESRELFSVSALGPWMAPRNSDPGQR